MDQKGPPEPAGRVAPDVLAQHAGKRGEILRRHHEPARHVEGYQGERHLALEDNPRGAAVGRRGQSRHLRPV